MTNGGKPDPIDAAIDATEGQRWQQANFVVPFSTGRNAMIGIPQDVTAGELLEAIDGVMHTARNIAAQRSLIVAAKPGDLPT